MRVAAHCIDADLGGFVAVGMLISLDWIGGAKRDRTADLLVANSRIEASPSETEEAGVTPEVWIDGRLKQFPVRHPTSSDMERHPRTPAGMPGLRHKVRHKSVLRRQHPVRTGSRGWGYFGPRPAKIVTPHGEFSNFYFFIFFQRNALLEPAARSTTSLWQGIREDARPCGCSRGRLWAWERKPRARTKTQVLRSLDLSQLPVQVLGRVSTRGAI